MLVMIPPHRLAVTGTEEPTLSTAAPMQKKTFLGTAYLFLTFLFCVHKASYRTKGLERW